jgi:hypothetical protein
LTRKAKTNSQLLSHPSNVEVRLEIARTGLLEEHFVLTDWLIHFGPASRLVLSRFSLKWFHSQVFNIYMSHGTEIIANLDHKTAFRQIARAVNMFENTSKQIEHTDFL